MDKYFIFFDETVLSTVFHCVMIIGIQIILHFIFKDRFKYWMRITIFILYVIMVFSIGISIENNDNNLFIKSSVNSIVVDRFEWKSGSYRCKLKSGIVMYWNLEIGDSIVKKANNDSFYVYRKDLQSGIYQLVSHRKY